MLNLKRNRIVFHVIVAGITLFMPVLDAPSPKPTALLMLNNPFVGIDFVLHFLCLLFGYFNYVSLVPNLFYRKSKTVYFLVVIFVFALFCLVPDILAHIPFIPYFPDDNELHIHTIIQVRHVFFLFMVILLYGNVTVAEERRRAAENERMIAEMRYLKAQINPHFLFNTLNSIYALLMVNPPEAGKSIIKMSNIMRHILKASENSSEHLSETLDILKDYIDLQKDRFKETIDVEYTVQGSPEGLQIAPLLIIPFIENAFKYGINPSEKSKIIIRIELRDNRLKLFVSNKDFQHLNFIKGSGIGMENTKRRLQLLYPGHYQLDIKKANGMFNVDLQLSLS
ncbi:MAG: histidine kinase [Chitinophagaceae bacterium]